MPTPEPQRDEPGGSDQPSKSPTPAVPGPKDKVYLIGFSATGKSHSGRLAAQALGARFVDMDRLIARRAGKQISDIFEQDGEEEFRRIEREVLLEAADSAGRRVISTGGGVPVDPRNREVMERSGFTIRLSASPETIHGRINRTHSTGERVGSRSTARRSAARPMLPDSENEETSIGRIRELLAKREEAYAAVTDVEINTEGREPPDVAAEIVDVIQRMAHGSGATA
ncbi:MAG: shikimate kinase [Chloroflexi bacterium]|nr:shikimate kinase [Chloroflexota bacterium]